MATEVLKMRASPREGKERRELNRHTSGGRQAARELNMSGVLRRCALVACAHSVRAAAALWMPD